MRRSAVAKEHHQQVYHNNIMSTAPWWVTNPLEGYASARGGTQRSAKGLASLGSGAEDGGYHPPTFGKISSIWFNQWLWQQNHERYVTFQSREPSTVLFRERTKVRSPARESGKLRSRFRNLFDKRERFPIDS